MNKKKDETTKQIIQLIVAVCIIVIGFGVVKVIGINEDYKHNFERNKADNSTVNTITTTTSTITKNTKPRSVENKKNTVKTNTKSTTTTKETRTTKPYSHKVTETTTIVTKSETEPEIELVFYDIPTGDTSFHGYMDYAYITDINSLQYQLQLNCWTDSQGIRRQGDDVCIALGSYYGTEIGTRYLITTDMGNSFTAVLADCKADIHTDYNNQYRDTGNGFKNVVEFIVDTYALDPDVMSSGNIGTYDNYSGNIVSIQKINQKRGEFKNWHTTRKQEKESVQLERRKTDS